MALDVLKNAMEGVEPPKAKKRGRAKAVENIPYLYTWIQKGENFELVINESKFLIKKEIDRYGLSCIIAGKLFKGERPSLEEAFKALDSLIYKQLRSCWTKIDCRALLIHFQGDLNL